MAFTAESHTLPANWNINPLTDIQISLVEGGGPTPANIIHVGDSIDLRIEFSPTQDLGWISGISPSAAFVGTVYFDTRGPGPDPATITCPAPVLVDNINPTPTYTMQFPITTSLAAAGVYGLTISLKFVNDPTTITWTYWHGMDEIPLVEVYS